MGVFLLFVIKAHFLHSRLKDSHKKGKEHCCQLNKMNKPNSLSVSASLAYTLLVNWKYMYRWLTFQSFKTGKNKSCKYFQGIFPCHWLCLYLYICCPQKNMVWRLCVSVSIDTHYSFNSKLSWSHWKSQDSPINYTSSLISTLVLKFRETEKMLALHLMYIRTFY